MKRSIIFCSLLASINTVPTAFAESSASVALTSNYLFRGVSLSDEDAAIQGAFDFINNNGYYAGMWGSSIATGESPAEQSGIELDVYTGFVGTLASGLDWDLGFIAYTYPGTEKDVQKDMYEFKAALGGEIWTGTTWYNWDDEIIYAELNGTWDMQEDFDFHLHVGYNKDLENDDVDPVVDYNMSFDKTVASGFVWSLLISHTNDDANDDVQFSFTLSKTM